MICVASIVCRLIIKFLHALLSELDQIGVITEIRKHAWPAHVSGDSRLVDGCEVFHPLFSILSKHSASILVKIFR